MTWTAFEVYDSVQVIPENDLKHHSTFHCKCHPKYEDGIFIHNSFDGREATETPLPS
ncbi:MULTISPECIES: hypothetical protein [Acinetobacter]|uniref:hypothetical protein n=1 Tax=Acinetobacter TaxID=469 RepID=UPI00148BC172|nr:MULTISPECIES: hypothetical protein [Acinetobacter]MBJ9727076.1 hypothetical protein [Acinetobacter nosocomialis]QNX86475.1 hypothetical protein IC772_12610 [Acinetobacter seifertii]